MTDNWFIGPATSDPIHNLARSLVNFCFPNASVLSNQSSGEDFAHEALKNILTGDNVKDFLHEYRHYHSHWPLIHIATFDPFSANPGLVLAMCCLGAVYSDKMGPSDVRWLIERVRESVLRTSRVYELAQVHQMADLDHQLPVTTEEIQALVLLHSQFLWHGSQQQRQQVRDEVRALANVTRCAALFQPLPADNPNASALHQPGPITGAEVDSWNWTVWIENEKRARLTAYIYLIDASSTIYFNTQPRFDAKNITVPLPADDAAWEAKNSEDCASALGLRGQAAQAINESGSRRAKQLSMSEALCVLNGACPGKFPERATNVFGKFSKSNHIPNCLRDSNGSAKFSSMLSTLKSTISSVSFSSAIRQAVQARLSLEAEVQPHHPTESTNKYRTSFARLSVLCNCGKSAGMQTLPFNFPRINVDVGSAAMVFTSTS